MFILLGRLPWGLKLDGSVKSTHAEMFVQSNNIPLYIAFAFAFAFALALALALAMALALALAFAFAFAFDTLFIYSSEKKTA